MLSPILRVCSLSRSYRQGIAGFETSHTVLRNLTLEVYQGETVCITGARGSGKTTLLYCLAGMLKPTSGSVQWFLEHRESSRRSRTPDIAYLPDTIPDYGFLTVGEAIDYCMAGRHSVQSQRELRIARLADLTGLQSVCGSRVSSLSRSLLRRLHLAQALAGGPRVLLLDEVISEMGDRDEVRSFKSIFRRLNKGGITIILASHNSQAAHVTAGRVIELVPGRSQGSMIYRNRYSVKKRIVMS